MIPIINKFGNFEVGSRAEGPLKEDPNYFFFKGPRLQPTCRRLGIEYCSAVVGFRGKKKYGYSPIIGGVVIPTNSVRVLRNNLPGRKKKRKGQISLELKLRWLIKSNKEN